MKSTLFLAPVMALAMASAAYGDAPSHVTIDSISYAGSGCPAGSVAENLSDDYTAFTLLFDDYIAEIGPGVSRRENHKNCQINIDLSFPQGWSFTVADVDYRGYVSLDRGVTATQQSRYYFQGSRASATLRSNYHGAIDEDYEIRDTLGLSALVWSPCGANRSLNINSQIRLRTRNRRATGLITLDSVDGQLTHVYGIKWRRCR